MNSRGEKLVSVYWFAILFIVAAGVVYATASFYGQPYDVREVEAEILSDKVAECVSHAGILKPFVFEEDFDERFLELCNLNFEVEDYKDWQDRGQYYVELNIKNFDTEDFQNLANGGNPQLKGFCVEGNTEKNNPYCLGRELYVLDTEGNQYELTVLTIVRKTDKNVQ